MKKLNVFMLALLIIGQTILGPIGVASANTDFTELEEETTSNENSETGDADFEGKEPEFEDTSLPIVEQEEPNEKEVEISGNNSAENENENEEVSTKDGIEEVESGEPVPSFSTMLLNPAEDGKDAEKIPAILESFIMTIDGQQVVGGDFSQELEQDATADFKVAFSVPMENNLGEAWGDESWFEFQLPNSLIDFDWKFEGGKTVNGITYTYSTIGNKVTVKLSGMEPKSASSQPETLTINFKSGFTLTEKDIEQDLEIPAAGGGTEKIKVKFTFKPTTSNVKVNKKKIGTPTAEVSGNHIMEWEVWVNEAGKQLTDAKLRDNATGGHAVVDGSVNVYRYTVDLDGVLTSTGEQVVTNGSWAAIDAVLTGKFAYKITYKSEVNLAFVDRDGEKSFNNTVTLFNDGQPKETSSNAQHKITYGKALEKHNATGNNYTKNWRIDYNHNLLNIPKDQAKLSDTISGPHEIDFSTIKVYKMNDSAGNIATTVPSSGELLSGFTVNPNTVTGKSFTITFDTSISDAYTITYQSKFIAKDFIEKIDIDGKTLTNTVTNGNNISKTGKYGLSENLLTKSRTIDVDNKTITWTIKIISDNSAIAISNLTLTDTFVKGAVNGVHTLIEDSVKLNGNNANYSLIGNDPTKGFTITGIDVAAGGYTTVTYTTSFAIENDGQVATQGYGNTANTEWVSGGFTYNKTATAEYIPGTTTVNNGSKSGKFDYSTQEFTWDVKVNINKKDIQGAILVDTVGEGHKFIPGSTIDVFPLTLSGSDDTAGTIGTTPIDTSNYSISAETDRGFTLTFESNLDSPPNNQAYVVRYKTVDDDAILGIDSSTPTDSGNVYTNSATFKTLSDHTFTLIPAKVTLEKDVANSLITKRKPNQNSSTEKITWTLDVNKSHSNLGENVELTDLPGDNLWLLEESIKIATYKVTTTGISNNSDWQTPAQLNIPLTFDTHGGFTLTFPSLENRGYQVKYETIGFGTLNGDLVNTATLHYSGETKENQKKEDKLESKFSFSSSDSNFTSTRGSAKFKKMGIDSDTGEVKDVKLPGVEFQLVKKTTNNEYIIKTATTDENGEITFENVPYNKYLIREVAAPTDYTKMTDFEFTLDENTTLDKKPDLVTVLVNTTPLQAGSCDTFTITVKDVDGELITSGKVTLIDRNGKETKITPNSSGEVQLPTNFPAGKYEVSHDSEGPLKEVTVKYDSNCKVTVQPTPTCELFTITIEDKNNNLRKGVTVKLTHKTDNTAPVIVKTTDATDGTIKLSTATTKPGVYTVYENKQYLGEVTITYKNTPCEATVIQAPTCPTFELTIKNTDGKNLTASTVVTVKDKNDDTKVIADKIQTDITGKLDISNLSAGEYDVYDKNGKYIGSFATNIDCEAQVQPAPFCELYTITVNDGDGNPRPKVEVNIEVLNKDGNLVIITATTNELGEITLPTTTKPGTYKVYEDKLFLGDVEVTYLNDNCKAIVQTNVPNAGTCPTFELAVNDRSNKPREGVVVSVQDGNGDIVVDSTDGPYITGLDGKVTFNNVFKPGIYNVYEVNDKGSKKLIDTFTVTTECFAEVKPRPVPPVTPTCEEFTITINQQGTTVSPNVELTLKSGTTEVKGKTDANGKIVIDKVDLPEGSYTAYDKDGKEVGTIVVSYDEDKCQVAIDLLVKSCETFTITVKESGKVVKAGTSLTLKDASGKTAATGTTDVNGKIVFAKKDLEIGSYSAYDKDGNNVGTITVTYDESKCQATIDLVLQACEDFKLTVGDTPNANIEIKDASGNTVVTGKTDSIGKVTFPQSIPEGNYIVYVNGEKAGEITVSDTCTAIITPVINAEEPTEPIDPEIPTKPSEPGKPNPEDPNGGELGDGGNKPGNNDGSKPEQPNKPGNSGQLGDDGDKLPQTGEEKMLFLLTLGFLLLVAGGMLLLPRRKGIRFS
ncbi:collagen binding domain-containing protein [Sporosarcina sp. CAU 1771]